MVVVASGWDCRPAVRLARGGEVVMLLPCPFCGSDRFKIVEVDNITSGYYYVECIDCESKGANAKAHFQAVANWQRRPQEEEAE
jgi:Lar family restriction alleviation protein